MKFVKRIFSLPKDVVLYLFLVLSVLFVGQFHIISSQRQQIDTLLTKNFHLSQSLIDTEEKIDSLIKTQNDIRVFQHGLDSFVKDGLKHVGKFAGVVNRVGASNPVFSLITHSAESNQAKLFKLDLAVNRARYDVSSLTNEALLIKNRLLKIPTIMPTRGYISSRFGKRIDPFTKKIKHHKGVDMVAEVGTPIYATAHGIVKSARFSQSYGNVIDLDHNGEYTTRYGHLQRILVSPGDMVMQGQIIGLMGRTGRCRGTHVHYEIYHKNRLLNPESLMAFAVPEPMNML